MLKTVRFSLPVITGLVYERVKEILLCCRFMWKRSGSTESSVETTAAGRERF